MKIIVGLGNPGKEYANTRHNIGFMVIDRLADRQNINQFKEKFKALIGELKYGAEKVLLVKPMTFMNASGQSVVDIINFFKVDPSDIMIIYDDMDLETGRLRIRKKGSAGGHNGMKSIIYQLQTDDFARLRIGIGKPSHSAVNFVLGNFSSEEKQKLDEVIDKASDAVEMFLAQGLDAVMNKYNEKG